MPAPDPIPTPRRSAVMRFRRLMRRMGMVSVAAAALAVILVAWGSEGWHIHMLIATALGVGLSVFLAAALMSLAFLSNSSGHDDQAAGPGHERDRT
jgi:hypothetical protein